MLADTLQMLHDTEEQAEQVIAQAHIKVREIEKQTYQEITKLENQTNAEIAAALAELPQPARNVTQAMAMKAILKSVEKLFFITECIKNCDYLVSYSGSVCIGARSRSPLAWCKSDF